MEKLSLAKKQSISGGSFYTIAMGIGILTSTLVGLSNNIIELATMKNSSINNTTKKWENSYRYGSYARRRKGAYVRYSPFPLRNTIGMYF